MAIPFEGTVIGADGKRYANNDPNIPDEQIRAYGMALRVSEVEDDVEALDGRVGDAEGDILALDGRVGDIETQLA